MDNSSRLDIVLKQIDKKYGKGTVIKGSQYPPLERFSSGIFSLDVEIGGGVPRGRVLILAGNESTGKAQPLTSKILTPKGYVSMGSIKEGDIIVDGEGKLTKVVGVFPQGVKPVYRINFNDRTSIEVSSEHINKVHRYNAGSRKTEHYEIITLELTKLVEESRYSIRVDIPTVDVWEDKDLLIDPYLLGFLLADGTLRENTRFSNSERDIVDKVRHKLKAIGYDIKTKDGTNWSIYRNDGINYNNYTVDESSLWECLRLYGLKVNSYDKHIPKEYLFASYETRLELLRGMFDGDGYVPTEESTLEYSTSSPQLSADFEFLVRSLGIVTTVSTKVSTYTSNGEKKEGRLSYRHHLRVPRHLKIFSSNKHNERWVPRTHDVIRSITSIEYKGEEECQCISVDSPSKTYLTDNFTPTHNTTVAKKILATAQHTCRNCGTKIGVDYETGEVRCVKCTDGGKPFKVFYCDIEGTFDPIWFEDLGGNVDELYLFQPEFAEQAVDVVEAMIRTGDIDIIVIDSIAMMSPAVEIEKSAEDQLMGNHAKLVNRMMRAIQSAFNSLGTDNTHKPTVLLINQLRERVGVMFGCNRGDVIVPFVDGTSARIKDIVDNKTEKEVWGFDENTSRIVPATIVGWFNNGKVNSHNDWVHIKTNVPDTKNGRAGAIVTKDHLIMTDGGWKKAKDITLEDTVLTKYVSKLNGTLAQFMYGAFIGDLHVAKSGRNNGYLVLEDIQNEEYVLWKVGKLSKAFKFDTSRFITVQGKEAIKYNSDKSYELGLWRQRLGGNRSIEIPIDKFTAMSLAVWYMDDGSMSIKKYGRNVGISAKRFKEEFDYNVERILMVMESFGLEVSWRQRDGLLAILTESHDRFFSLIAKYVPECMQYKLPEEYRGLYEDFELDFVESIESAFVPVSSIGTATYRSGLLDKYDIEVDGCHSYLVGNRANGFIVHNSPDTMPGGKGQSFASSITLKFFARPSERIHESVGDKKPVGQQIRFNVDKNKTFPPHKQGLFTLYTDDSEEYGVHKGKIDNQLSIVKYGVRYEVIEKAGSWFSYTMDSGEEIRVQGEEKFVQTLDSRPDVATEVAKKTVSKALGDVYAR